MKRQLLVASAALAAALSATACDETLTETPFAELSADQFFANRADAIAAIHAVYRSLGPGDNNMITGWQASIAIESGSDMANVHPSDQNFRGTCPGNLACDASIPPMVEPWAAFYRTIFLANVVIDRVPDTPDVTDADKAIIVAEAKLLRAFAHHELEKRYADVPINLTPAGPEDQSRRPHAEVHAQVIKDAKEAEAALPATRPANEHGRVTSGAARALIADRYLWNASRWGSGAAEYDSARVWADRAITSGRYTLQNDYITAFLPNNKGNAEVMWVLPSSGIDNRTSLGTLTLFWPRETTGSTGFGTATPTKWAFEGIYEPGDYRKEVVFRTSGCNFAGTVCFPNGFPQGPHPYKYRPTTPNNATPSDVDWVFYRIADMYLIRAEARAALDDHVGAIADLNVLRTRARRGNGAAESRAVPANLPTTGWTPVTLRDAIYNERNRELIWENKRWFDLVRRDTQDPGYWANELAAHDPASLRFYHPSAVTFRKLWPLPQRELDLLKGILCQNPGYGGECTEPL